MLKKFKTKNFLIKFSLLVGLVMGVIEQPVSAYIFDAEQREPFDVTFDYDFKYSPEISSSSSQVTDADEIDNSNYDLYDGNVNRLGYSLNNNEKRSAKIHVYRRGCIRRNGACDHRPKDCCYNSSCRCNLWGSNCRCQRMGLFQKWG